MIYRHESYLCAKGHRSLILVAVSQRHETQKCRKCGQPASHSFAGKERESVRPFVYYENKQGEIFFTDGKLPPPAHKRGYQRREATTEGDRRAVLNRLNATDRAKYAERVDTHRERAESVRNRTLARTEAFMQAGVISEETGRVIRERASRAEYGKNYDPGNHFTVWE